MIDVLGLSVVGSSMALSGAKIAARYRARHPERIKARDAAKHAADPGYSTRQMRKWRAANPERARSAKLRHKYGIDVQGVAELFAKQNGQCAIASCQRLLGPGRRTHIDHDHATGRVRGLLCPSCNRGLVFLEKHMVAGTIYLRGSK